MEILKDEGIKIVRNYENIGELPQNFVKDFLGWIDREDVEFHDGLAVIEKFGERRYGYINRNFEIVIPVKYSIVRHFREGLAAVFSGGKWGYFNQDGKQIIPFMYKCCGNFHEGLAWVRLNGKYGYINQQGEEITPCKYDDTGNFYEGLAAVKLNGKCGYINQQGEEVISCKYDHVRDFHEGITCVKLYGTYGLINKNGTEILSPKYDYIDDFCEGLARTHFSDKWGYINQKGEKVIPCEYDFIGNFHEGYALVKERNEYILIDRNGKIVFSNSDKMRYLGEGVYLIFEKEHARYATIGEILATTRKNWEKISFKDINTMNIEKLREASRKISTSYDVKRYFDLIVDGEVFSFDTKEERDEYEQKLLETSKDEKHYTKK